MIRDLVVDLQVRGSRPRGRARHWQQGHAPQRAEEVHGHRVQPRRLPGKEVLGEPGEERVVSVGWGGPHGGLWRRHTFIYQSTLTG